MNCMATKFRSLALLAAVATAAACAGKSTNQPAQMGLANVGVTLRNALQATSIAKMVLTVGTDSQSGTPSFANQTYNMTNNDLSKSLTWSAYVTGIPAGTMRLFSVVAYDSGNNILYQGSAHANITVGATASVAIVLQGQNDGTFSNSLPVVDSLTASANSVTVGTTPPPSPVVLTFGVHDPDNNTMTYAFTDTCGSTFSAASGAAASDLPNPPGTINTVTWTPPTTAPTSGVCTLALTVTDTHQGSVTAFLSIPILTSTTGSVVVTAYPNSWPMISNLAAQEYYTKSTAGALVGVDIDLSVLAGDPDGDDLTYTWSSPNCTGTFTNGLAPDNANGTGATLPAGSATLAYGPGQFPASNVHFRTADITDKCIIQVAVTDSWKNGVVPAGSGLPVARGGDTIGLINASSPAEFVVGPQIVSTSAPSAPKAGTVTPTSATFLVQAGQTVTLSVTTSDPSPSDIAPAVPFTYTWTATPAAGLGTAVTTGNFLSADTWTAANPVAPGSSVTVTVTNAYKLTASYTWNFAPSNPCTSAGATQATACDPGLGLCADPGYNGTTNLGGHCDANAGTSTSQCVANNPVVCTAEDQCHSVGVCNPGTGVCTNPTLTNGTACNADSNGCTQNDSCQAGTCTAGAPVVCATPPNSFCYAATSGTCVSTGNNAFTCNYAPTVGQTCTVANAATKCSGAEVFSTFACDATGTCTGSGPVACTTTQCSSGGSCSATTGACAGGSNQPLGTACSDGNPCTGTTASPDACDGNGNCVGGAPFCQAGQSCTASGSSATCTSTVVAPQVAKDLPVSGPVGLAMDTSGASYVAGAIYNGPYSFDGLNVSSGGDADIFIAKYNGSDVAQWAVNFGDGASANPQVATGAALTSDGTLAVIGNFSGTFSIGTGNLSSASQIDFLAGVNSASGAGKWALQFNDGANGLLKAVGANPNDASATGNRIAVCGLANGTAPTNFVGSGATTPVGNDIIIGVFTSAGAPLWAAQFGSTNNGNDDCDAITVDDNGDVVAAGTFTGQTLSFGGTAPSLTGPNLSTKKYLWVAKFNGKTGAAIDAVAFNGTTGQATPASIVTDPSDNIVVGGQFTANLSFGATTLTSAGLADAFVAKISSTFAPVWAVRLGGTGSDAVNGVAVDSFGDVVATGLFNKTTTGAATLTASTTTASNPFVLKLNGSTGATDSANGYGDQGTATGDALAINRYGASPNAIAIAGSMSAQLTFGTPGTASPVTPVNATDVWLAIAKLQ